MAASTRHGFRSLTCVTPTASLCGSGILGSAPGFPSPFSHPSRPVGVGWLSPRGGGHFTATHTGTVAGINYLLSDAYAFGLNPLRDFRAPLFLPAILVGVGWTPSLDVGTLHSHTLQYGYGVSIIPIYGLLTLLVGIRSGISGGCPRLLAL